MASPSRPQEAIAKLDEMVASSRFADAARAFANRYRHFNATEQIDRIVQRLDLLARGETIT